MTLFRVWLALLLLCAVAFVNAGPYVEIPKLSARVTDLTGTLTPVQVETLENKLAAFEAKKGSQIAVLIVATTQPSDIAEFGIEVADLWRIGRKGVDDGLIMIVAKDDRKMRLEVGYGLEGVIPDAVAKRIIAETMTPLFKSGDYFSGINAGVDQIINLVEGEQLPAPQTRQDTQQNDGSFLFVLFGGLFAGSLFTSLFGRALGAVIAGIASGLVAALFLGFGIGAMMVGILVFFLLAARFTGGGGWSNGGGYYRGGGGSSWSGGGGGFGGGGASGSW